jgi:phage/plasmid-like protein (TIGR03299 family)
MKGNEMPAAVETYGEMAAFASLRTPAWHTLGTVFTDPVSTLEMLELAMLNGWDVRLEDIILPARTHRNYYATVRTNPFDGGNDVLGIVKDRYVPFQNEELFAFGDSLLSDGRWETAGSIKNGTVVFGSLALDREVVLDPSGVEDKVNTYLLVHTSHDGSLSIQASVTPVRVVCQNTLNMALRNNKQTYKIRHTEKAEDRLVAAREALGIAHKYVDAFEKEAAALFAQSVDDNKFFDIIKAAYPMPDEANVKGAVTKWQNKADALFTIWNGPTEVGIKGTAWGAYNALTERLDWGRTPRKGDAENVYAAAAGFDNVTNVEKNRLLKVVKTLAKAA